MGSFSDWRPALLFPHAEQYVVTAEFNGTNRYSCLLGLLGRENMVWKYQQIAFTSNDLAVVLQVGYHSITQVASKVPNQLTSCIRYAFLSSFHEFSASSHDGSIAFQTLED